MIAAYWIKTARTPAALRARRRDPDWIAPVLWLAEKAEATMQGKLYSVDTPTALKLVERTRHASYDCAFVALAQAQSVPLVTGDRTMQQRFPDVAVLLEDFAA